MQVISPSGSRCRVDADLGRRLLGRGWQQVGDPVAVSQPPAQSEPVLEPGIVEAVPALVGKPSKSASRGVWAGYAKTLGVEVEGLTRAQIVELVGGLSDE